MFVEIENIERLKFIEAIKNAYNNDKSCESPSFRFDMGCKFFRMRIFYSNYVFILG